MPATGKRSKPRGKQFRTARHLEKRDSKRGQYAATRKTVPNSHEFGTAEYIDAQGRQYRLGIADNANSWTPGVPIPPLLSDQRGKMRARADGTTELWIRLHKGTKTTEGWFSPGDLAAHSVLELLPTIPGLPKQRVRVVRATRGGKQQRGRTGSVFVAEYLHE